MGGWWSTPEQPQGHVAFSSSSSSMGPGGGHMFGNTFTGQVSPSGKVTGTGMGFQQMFPHLAASFVFDCVAIFTIAIFTILVIKFLYKGKQREPTLPRYGRLRTQSKNIVMVEMKEIEKAEPV